MGDVKLHVFIHSITGRAYTDSCPNYFRYRRYGLVIASIGVLGYINNGGYKLYEEGIMKSFFIGYFRSMGTILAVLLLLSTFGSPLAVLTKPETNILTLVFILTSIIMGLVERDLNGR